MGWGRGRDNTYKENLAKYSHWEMCLKVGLEFFVLFLQLLYKSERISEQKV